jgi:hypothetical protein
MTLFRNSHVIVDSVCKIPTTIRFRTPLHILTLLSESGISCPFRNRKKGNAVVSRKSYLMRQRIKGTFMYEMVIILIYSITSAGWFIS